MSRRILTPRVVIAAAATEHSVESDTSPSVLSNGPLPSYLVKGELIGSGTFGEVFRGYDCDSDREVAIKVISKKRQGSDPASMALMKQRIEHEVSMWCALQSFPHAVRLNNFYEVRDASTVSYS